MIEYHEFQHFAFHEIFLQKILIQSCFCAELFLIVNRFSNLLSHILGQIQVQLLQRKYFAFNQMK